ncbi:fluoride efflux transporter CrcB [Neisseriaceae bacterium ESL0693]|nr:fluoride efflux transporter CrcB [Neisseriaceae bacterium ESL0693]
MLTIIAIAGGAALGAIVRWLLSLALNGINPALPYGTLAANWIGAYIIGVAAAVFLSLPLLAPQWRAFIITGFLGGLTTFSTFSLEAISLIQHQRWGWMLLHVCLHLAGSLLLTVLGLCTVQWFKSH